MAEFVVAADFVFAVDFLVAVDFVVTLGLVGSNVSVIPLVELVVYIYMTVSGLSFSS